MQSSSLPEDAASGDSILRILWEGNEETFAAAKNAIMQRVLVATAQAAFEDLGSPDAIARQALEHPETDHALVRSAASALTDLLIEDVARRSMDDLADPAAAARQARERIEKDHQAVVVAKNLLKVHLLDEIAQGATDDLADPKAVAQEARQRIEEETLINGRKALIESLLAEIADRSTEAIADAQQAAVQARKHIDDEPIGGAVVEERPPAPPTRTEAPETPSSTPKMQRRKAANGYPEEIPPEAAPSAHLAQAHYVHGIVAHRGRGLIEALAAIDSETIYRPYVIPFKTVAAVASRVPGALTENDGWKALKGVQAGLLEHLSQKGAAVLPMYAETLYASEADLVAILAAHAHTLEVHLGELSGKQEWAVKIYCDPERIKQEVHSTDASIDAFLGQILVDVHEWSARGPAEELKALQEGMDLSLAELLETVQLNCQQGVHRALQGISEDSRLASSSEEEPVFGQSRMVLSASYLVAESEAEAFRAELERLAAEYERLGLVYYIGGPHPPCRFTVRGAPEL